MGFTEETSSPAPVFTITPKSPNVDESMNNRTTSDQGERKKDEPDLMTCWQKIRHSTNTSTFLVFLILFLDGLLLTSIGLLFFYFKHSGNAIKVIQILS